MLKTSGAMVRICSLYWTEIKVAESSKVDITATLLQQQTKQHIAQNEYRVIINTLHIENITHSETMTASTIDALMK